MLIDINMKFTRVNQLLYVEACIYLFSDAEYIINHCYDFVKFYGVLSDTLITVISYTVAILASCIGSHIYQMGGTV